MGFTIAHISPWWRRSPPKQSWNDLNEGDLDFVQYWQEEKCAAIADKIAVLISRRKKDKIAQGGCPEWWTQNKILNLYVRPEFYKSATADAKALETKQGKWGKTDGANSHSQGCRGTISCAKASTEHKDDKP